MNTLQDLRSTLDAHAAEVTDSATTARVCGQSVTSSGNARTSAPRARHASAWAAITSARLAEIATRAPRATSGAINASPMPELAPVIQTT